MTIAALLIAFAAASVAPETMPPTAAAAPATLTVVFEGMEQSTGAILFQLFDSEAAYGGKGGPVRAEMLPVGAGQAETRLKDLPSGRYAIRAMHDVDGDGKLATNPFGIPVEPVAFSNNAPAQGGPAPWPAASFEVKPGTNVHRITIR